MRTTIKAALVATTLATAALAGAGQAAARENFGVYVGPDSLGLYVNKGWHKRPYARTPSSFGMWYADRMRYRPFLRARWNARECFPVTKYGYNDWGRQVLIRATMCYDRFGKTYVVPGSRKVIRTL